MSTTCVQLVSTYKPKSIGSINTKAEQLLNHVLPNQPYDQPIPIDCLIDLNLPNVLDYQLELTDAPMHIEGAAIITSDGDKKIIIPENTFKMAMNGDSRSRFTLAHELGHIALKHYNGETVTGNLKMSKQHIPSFRDPEWQANTFAGAILVPYTYLKQLSNQDMHDPITPNTSHLNTITGAINMN